jgi:hypothetical protein
MSSFASSLSAYSRKNKREERAASWNFTVNWRVNSVWQAKTLHHFFTLQAQSFFIMSRGKKIALQIDFEYHG